MYGVPRESYHAVQSASVRFSRLTDCLQTCRVSILKMSQDCAKLPKNCPLDTRKIVLALLGGLGHASPKKF